MKKQMQFVSKIGVLATVLGLGLSAFAQGAAKDWPIEIKRAKDIAQVATIAAPGETVVFEVPVTNRLAAPVQVKLTFTLFDFWEKERGSMTHDLALKTNEGQKVSVRFAAPDKGIFKVGVSYELQGKKYSRDVASFAAWPVPPAKRNKDTFFRDAISCWEGDGSQLKQAARLGQSWVINHDVMQATWWAHLQPTNGPFLWSKMEYQVTNAIGLGFSIVGSFHTAPAWASINPETAKQTTKGGYPLPVVPRDDLWRTYVRETVNHYKDRIKYWQVGNEPHGCLFWMGSIEQFAGVCQSAGEEAHKADPGCTVLGAGLAYSYTPWLERFAKAGGFANFDAISYHGYIPHDPPEMILEDLGPSLDNLRELMRQYPPHRELPIWDTEGGDSSTTWLRGELPEDKMSWRIPPYKLVKYYAVEMSLGVVCHFYYLQNGASIGGLTPLDVNGAPKPLLMARIAMQGELDGMEYRHTFRSGETKGRVWAMLFESKDQNRTVALCWAGEKGEVEITADWGGKLKDIDNLMGNTSPAAAKLKLTEEPQYLHFAGSATNVLPLFEKAAIQVLKEPEALPKPPSGEIAPKLQTGTGPFAAALENPKGNFTVDLRPYCTMGFADDAAGDGKGGWYDEGPLNDMRSVEPGMKTYYGLPFDVIDPAKNNGKSVITMKGMTTPNLPGRVEIDLKNLKCRALYFLHAGQACENLASYEITYTSGEKVSLPLIPGKNIDNWWLEYQKGEESKLVAFLSLAKNTVDGKPAYRYLRVWEWQNPKPQETIKTVSIVVTDVKNAYQQTSLVALSGTQW